MLVDSHCHLDYPEFDDDRSDLLNRARTAGVERFLTISVTLKTFPKVRAVAEANEDIYCTVGVHPHHAHEDLQDSADVLIERAQHPKVVGIGETGLDYFYEHAPREAQKQSFIQHIEASRALQLPLIIHARDADPDTIDILLSEYKNGPFPGLIHCFTAGPELAKAALDIGFMISISGIITFKKAEALRETVRGIPLESLLVETDSPYLAPMPHRGKRNEPAFVVHTAEALAALKDVPLATLAQQTTDNFYKLFTKIPR